MKELSTEEKAKRYDEVVAMAKECITHIPDEAVNKYMLNMFPELKESEDEKIRKELIAVINDLVLPNEQKERFNVWFEKQSCKDSQLILPQFMFDDILALQCCMETVKKVQEDKDLYEKLKDLHGRVYDAYQLGKQNDNADKFEPKFKVGDWVVTDKGDTVQIGAVNNGYYTLFNGMDFNMSYVDKCWHKWTIQDAKDGDVLVCGDNPNDHHVEVIMIFKSLRNKLSAFTHFHIFYNEFRTDNWCNCGKNAHPASKEQRSLLFQKMKVYGYEWNADKKELKKL